MAEEYKINSPDLERLAKELGNSHPVFMKHAKIMLTKQTTYLEGLVINETPVGATQALRNSIFGDVRMSGMGLFGIVATPEIHGESVEIGRKPGRMPPVEALIPWARRILGDESLAFVVARSIAKKGTKGQFMFKKAYTSGRTRLQFYVDETPDRITKELGFK